jgi:hypothetical protein
MVSFVSICLDFFFHFCDLIRSRGLLQDIVHMCVKQLTVALNTSGCHKGSRCDHE